jgi:hypothetical protein
MSANGRSLSFAGLIYRALTEDGHEVTWADPSVTYTKASLLNKFDAVLVGVSPITSLSANRVYGALSIIDHLWGSEQLTLFIDAPQVNQINFSLKAIQTTPGNFAKSFFSNRKEYSAVSSDEKLQQRLLKCVDKMVYTQWPTVMYPALPWSSTEKIKELLPEGVTSLVGINLDSYIIEDRVPAEERRSKWVVDLYKNSWVEATLKTLVSPHAPMKWNKGWTDVQVLEQIDRSMACLIAPHKREGSWWTTRFAQALSSLTPVVTDWKESSQIGPEWSLLAAHVESLSESQRLEVASSQRSSYLQNIPSKSHAVAILSGTIKLTTIMKESN